MNFTIRVDDKKDKLLVVWDSKSPSTEAHFHEAGGAWDDYNTYRFPLDTGNFRKAGKLAKRLGGVTISPEDKKYIRNLMEREKAVKELTHADSDAEVSDLLASESPSTAEALRSYQRAGVKFLTINDSALLADSPGAGKTLQTIATMISSGVQGDILVLAPSAAVQVTWPAEIKRWSPDDEVLRVTGTRPKRELELSKLKRESTAKRRWVLCNIEMAKTKYISGKAKSGKVVKPHYQHVYPELFFIDYSGKQKTDRLWSAIVVDESHRALITDKGQAYKQTQTRCGLGELKTVPGGKRIAISGTPFRGKLNNLWGTLNWLFPEKYTSYWDWISRWFDTESNYFGGTEIAQLSHGRESDFHAAMASFTLRRTKGEIAPDLPPKVYAGSVPEGVEFEPGKELGLVGHWLDMSPKQKRAYNEMVKDAQSNLESGTLVANGVLAELTRLKQFASCYGKLEKAIDVDGYEIPKFVPEMPSNKFDWLVEFFAELGILPNEPQVGPEARKVVVASQFTSVINLYERELNRMGIPTLKITGGVSPKKREQAVEDFQSEEGPQVFLLNTIAGGVSLTLDRADDIVILDETFIPDDQEQVEDRVHRVSRNHNVMVHYVRSKGTVEERIARLTFNRNNLQKQLLDGERGIDFARQIVGDK
ncbi:MAG: DEAD/DEAH box helicase [Alphaproteobacteria bacterium]|nr:DEAD/DEAH box helicase [Alphaproteobacteria bacterium]